MESDCTVTTKTGNDILEEKRQYSLNETFTEKEQSGSKLTNINKNVKDTDIEDNQILNDNINKQEEMSKVQTENILKSGSSRMDDSVEESLIKGTFI